MTCCHSFKIVQLSILNTGSGMLNNSFVDHLFTFASSQEVLTLVYFGGCFRHLKNVPQRKKLRTYYGTKG